VAARETEERARAQAHAAQDEASELRHAEAEGPSGTRLAGVAGRVMVGLTVVLVTVVWSSCGD
jgi:hypothetical protein